MITTLNKIKSCRPRTDFWETLLRHLGKTQADDEPLSIATVLDSNGFDDALWCLRAVEGHDREIRLFAVWCARQVQHSMTDKRSIAALDVAERFANGEATHEEFAAARAAARNAWAVAWAAAEAAVKNAVWGVAWPAAMAARAAARAADGATANDAVWAAGAAARASVWAIEHAAWFGARDAARAAQAKELRRICAEIESFEEK